MLLPSPSSSGKRLRELFGNNSVLLPGVFNGISALAATKAGARGLYISGAGLSNAAGVPDIALLDLGEFSRSAAQITQVSSVPVISDADTGFGGVQNVRRTVIEMERSGLAGIHLEDQTHSKRCGHLDGKSLIDTGEMVAKIKAAVAAKKDPDFLIIARTDARSVEGFDAAVIRAHAYVEAGADAVFPEGLISENEFSKFRSAIKVPLLANMTEFGKTPIIPFATFAEMKYEMVIYPMTVFRVMLAALEDSYQTLIEDGSQNTLLPKMRTRAELYSALEYDQYNSLENDLV